MLYFSTNAVQQAVIAQDKAINMIADMGACVIVGRAADYVLRSRDNVVRIFIHAPQDFRVKKSWRCAATRNRKANGASPVPTAPAVPITRAFPVGK